MKTLLVGLFVVGTVGTALGQSNSGGPDSVPYPLQGTTATDQLRDPSGKPFKRVKCSHSTDNCFREATRECGGSYNVIDSESHAGGLIADLFPGPVTWYGMTYRCGRSDGRMPSFAFRGPQWRMPDMGPTFTNCQNYGGFISCQHY